MTTATTMTSRPRRQEREAEPERQLGTQGGRRRVELTVSASCARSTSAAASAPRCRAGCSCPLTSTRWRCASLLTAAATGSCCASSPPHSAPRSDCSGDIYVFMASPLLRQGRGGRQQGGAHLRQAAQPRHLVRHGQETTWPGKLTKFTGRTFSEAEARELITRWGSQGGRHSSSAWAQRSFALSCCQSHSLSASCCAVCWCPRLHQLRRKRKGGRRSAASSLCGSSRVMQQRH